jgi:Peptidase family M23
MKLLLASIVSAVLLMQGCGGSAMSGSEPLSDSAEVRATPIVARVDNVPIPVKGSDNRFHVAYELTLVNFTGATASLQRLNVLDARSRAVVASLDAGQFAQRLAVASSRSSASAELGPSQTGLVYLHLTFDDPSAIPATLTHELTLTLNGQPVTETVAPTAVNPPTNLVLAPPLKGGRYVAGDGCCDSIRHVRATLPLNGHLYNGQRFAIDWELLDAQGRIHTGDPKVLQNYAIYGQPVYAVADATVIAAVDGMPDSPPGALPANIGIEQADGNHVVLDLGNGHYALYAHLAPNSVKVVQGQRVRQGDVLGLVGSSGNSSEPHLHFQVSDGPNPLASNGVPYLIGQFVSSQRGVSTEAFDQAIVDGQPLALQPLDGSSQHVSALPLDLSIVDFTH